MQREPAHGSAGIELLRDRNKARTALLKYGQQAREVEQGTAEPIHFVNHYAINLAGLDVGEQLLECRPLQARSAEPTILVALCQCVPAVLLLTEDVGFGCL